MTAVSDLYVGSWDLVPELCVYDDGAPPEHATYAIDRDGAEVRIVMSWRPSGSTEMRSVEFAGQVDGKVRPLPESRHLTGLSMTRVDERTLDTAAWDGDVVISSARRTASADGTLLVVLQATRRDDGGDVRSVQVYRRQLTGRPRCR